MIAIIDYGASNLRSVTNAIRQLGYQPVVTSRPEDITGAVAVFLPGVGAAPDTMANLEALGLAAPIKERIAGGQSFFGVCVGLQVLLTDTEEGGGYHCMDIIPGRVKKLPDGLKIPHMGWNQVKQLANHPLFKGVPETANFYFVHSYYAEPIDRSQVIGETDYGQPFASVIACGNLVATQFHPEKSGEAGLKIYDNFIKLAQSRSKSQGGR
ncbi:MAG: imidazole glycerol phosphate synthase subunit HisH [Dehalococcoidales bacterium]|jgi:glutamine amidotransferase